MSYKKNKYVCLLGVVKLHMKLNQERDNKTIDRFGLTSQVWGGQIFEKIRGRDFFFLGRKKRKKVREREKYWVLFHLNFPMVYPSEISSKNTNLSNF